MILLSNLYKKIKKYYHQKVLKKRYFRTGKCLKCGCCCENIYVRHNGKVIKNKEEFEHIKNNDSYSFYQHISIISQDEFGLVFECDRFDKEKRICTNHKARPSICKNYPSEEIFSFGACLQDKCGFKFTPIESFEEVFSKISKKPTKEFETISE